MSQTKAQLIDNLVSPITGALGSASAPTFSFTADPNTGVYSPGADQLAVTTGGTGRLFIDSSGRLLAGTSTARSNFFGTTLSSITQIEGTGGAGGRGALSVINNDVSNNPPYVLLGRSGAATLGSNAAVVNGSRLGTLTFHGADGTSFIEAATVAGEVDSTPGANDMPGRLVFSTTADGAASPTERLRITSAGLVGVGTSSPGEILAINGASNAEARLKIQNQTTTIGYLGSHLGIVGSGNANDLILSTGGATNLTFGINTVEKVRIDSSGRLLVGTSSSPSGGSGQYAKIVTQGYVGNDAAEGSIAIQRGNVASNITTGQAIGNITFNDSAGQAFGQIYCYADANAGTSDYPGRLVFSTTADGAASPTEAVRITSAQDLMLSQSGSGIFVGTTADGAFRIGRSSFAVSTGTLYIGNAAIQVSSDVRLKENIKDTSLDALDAISKIKVKDFTWKDPSDTSHNNRNARGKWTGLIAQELVEVLPFVVNAPRKEEDGLIDHDNESIWTLDQSQLCPVLIKAIQQQQAIIASLEARLTALETA